MLLVYFDTVFILFTVFCHFLCLIHIYSFPITFFFFPSLFFLFPSPFILLPSPFLKKLICLLIFSDIICIAGGTNVKQCTDSGDLHRRLRKIIGQVQAVDRMIDEDIPCEDILTQISAAKSALNKAGQIILENHIRHCVKDGIENGNADETIENFTKAIERFANMK